MLLDKRWRLVTSSKVSHVNGGYLTEQELIYFDWSQNSNICDNSTSLVKGVKRYITLYHFYNLRNWKLINSPIISGHQILSFNVKMFRRKFSRLRQSFIKISRNIEVFCKAQNFLFDSYLCSFMEYIFINIYIIYFFYVGS